MTNVNDVVQRKLSEAIAADSGRSAELIAHDGVLRQTVIALREGTRLGEHNSPPAATLQVLKGAIRVDTREAAQGEFREGELWVLTHERHSVLALEDSAFLLSTVTSVGEGSFS